ncbi:hypothetical protein ABKA04_001666 [Annulohypoxylon sp. FPYF3050]
MSITFDNILNFRDVGKTVNDHLGRKLVREGVLYRSARPDDASLEDRKRLRDEFGIKTVVDLRTKCRRHIRPDPGGALPADQGDGTAVREVHRGPALVVELLVSLPASVAFEGGYMQSPVINTRATVSKLIFLFALGYRVEAISLISQEVLLPRGLVGLGLVTIDESGAEIADTLRTLLVPSSTPLLVHCTQGKDRTGLIIALILMILSVPTSAIDHDYMLSTEGLSSEREIRMKEIRDIGLTAEWGDSSPDFVSRVVEHIDVKYGGVEGYLDSVGFDASERQRLVEVLGA